MIRLTRPTLDDEEVAALREVLGTGMLVQGARVEAMERAVAGRCGRAHGVAVSSGTTALHLALRALGIGSGDEVLCPDLTWPSPAHAVILCGATPVLVDVCAEEWNATAQSLAAARTPRTAAAIVIDQFGNPARAAEIEEELGGLPIVEDSACALGSRFADGRPCGGLGAVSCLSFHPRKVITTGEGGMCLTDDASLADELRALRNHGQTATGFRVPSGNHRLSELAAAVGLVQVDRLDWIVGRRIELAARYRAALDLPTQRPPEGAVANGQTFGLLLPAGSTAQDRDRAVRALREQGIEAGLLSYALHRVPTLAAAAQAAEEAGRAFPHSETIVDRGLALPLYPELGEDDQDRIIAAVAAVAESLT